MSEPIYDLPCIAESCPEMCKKLGEKKSETHENNKKEEGLHYLVSANYTFICSFSSYS